MSRNSGERDRAISFPTAISRISVPVFTIFLVHVVAGFIFLSPAYIRPDSVGVASWLRSAVIDQDLLFFNEWKMFGLVVDGATMFKEVGESGALANHWWIGFSILAAAPYVGAHLLSLL
ncbi:MAG: hypothetical protein R3338_12485, partial [Thermoanaerobaculia bacterium]|nr:hypothetical protein [Thermoanaerobaculia bacterium]